VAVLPNFVRFKLPDRGNGSVLRCDHCRRELSGIGVHRYCHMQFCSSSCMTAYQQRLTQETKAKIYRLDVSRS